MNQGFLPHEPRVMYETRPPLFEGRAEIRHKGEAIVTGYVKSLALAPPSQIRKAAEALCPHKQHLFGFGYRIGEWGKLNEDAKDVFRLMCEYADEKITFAGRMFGGVAAAISVGLLFAPPSVQEYLGPGGTLVLQTMGIATVLFTNRDRIARQFIQLSGVQAYAFYLWNE